MEDKENKLAANQRVWSSLVPSLLVGGEKKSLVSTMHACAQLSRVQAIVGRKHVIHVIYNVTYNLVSIACSEERNNYTTTSATPP